MLARESADASERARIARVRTRGERAHSKRGHGRGEREHIANEGMGEVHAQKETKVDWRRSGSPVRPSRNVKRSSTRLTSCGSQRTGERSEIPPNVPCPEVPFEYSRKLRS
jgi:hypothetical protein